MDYSVCSGDRDRLVSILREFSADRARDGSGRRSAEAAEAADALELGGELAYFERVVYIVGDDERYSVHSGTREEIINEMGDAARGWEHQGRRDLCMQACDGQLAVKAGAWLARVGHIVYLVRV